MAQENDINSKIRHDENLLKSYLENPHFYQCVNCIREGADPLILIHQLSEHLADAHKKISELKNERYYK